MEKDLSESRRYTKTHNLIRWKSGESIDPKLLALLEIFGDVYNERRGFFKKIFDVKYEGLFAKIGGALKRRKKMKKAKGMCRSMSMGEIGSRGIDQEMVGIRLERFKVKTPNVIVDRQDGPSHGV